MSTVTVTASRPWLSASPRALVWWTIIVTGAVRLILSQILGYGFGEGYYLASARHFALSYFDQPPLSLWIAWASIKLFGVGQPLLIRLPFVLMFAVTTWVMYRLGARLFSERAGAFAAILLNCSPVFSLSAGGWVQPDGPLMLTLLLAALAVVELRFGKPKHPLWLWAGAGAAFGLAMLSKYHAALILAGLVIFIVTTWKQRAWVLNRGLLIAAVIATVIFIPVVIWNAQNDWVSFVFQGDRIVSVGRLRFDWVLRSVIGQAIIVGPVIWPPLIFVFYRALVSGPRDERSWFLASLAIVPIIVFTVAALWASLGYHFHWQAPGYLFLFPLLGKFTAEGIEAGKAGTRRGVIGAGAFMAIAVLALGTQATLGWARWIMPRAITDKVEVASNPTREMLSWTAVRQQLQAQGYLDRPWLFAIGPQWHQTGKVDVQVGDKLPVVCLCGDPRNIAYGWDPNAFLGWDALIIGTDAYIPDVHAAYDPYFDSIELLDTVDIYLGGAVDRVIKVYLAHNYRAPYPLPVGPGSLRQTAGK